MVSMFAQTHCLDIYWLINMIAGGCFREEGERQKIGLKCL